MLQSYGALAVDLVCPGIEKVDRGGRLSEKIDDLFGGNRRAVFEQVSIEQIEQASLGKLHRDHDVAAVTPHLVHLHEVGGRELLDHLDKANLLSWVSVGPTRQEFESKVLAADLRLPNVAVAAASEETNQPV